MDDTIFMRYGPGKHLKISSPLSTKYDTIVTQRATDDHDLYNIDIVLSHDVVYTTRMTRKQIMQARTKSQSFRVKALILRRTSRNASLDFRTTFPAFCLLSKEMNGSRRLSRFQTLFQKTFLYKDWNRLKHVTFIHLPSAGKLFLVRAVPFACLRTRSKK